MKGIEAAKLGKAAGVDKIPSEVLKKDTSLPVLHSLFNVCFETGQVPLLWKEYTVYC